MRVSYSPGYKYIIRDNFSIQLPGDWPNCGNGFVRITDNWLHLREGYAFDGMSGFIKDTKRNMRGAAVHDGLYQLLRESLLPRGYQSVADIVAKTIWIEDGVHPWLAGFYYSGLRMVSPFTARKPIEILYAP